MKKGITTALILLLITSLFSCGTEKTGTVIGISKYISHPALDAIEQGIQDQLAEYNIDDISFDLQNANGDMDTTSTIAQKFKSDKVDVAVGIATPTAQSLANIIKDIPVVYSAVTDPVNAGLVDSYDAGLGNVTGASDLTPVRAQIELLASLTEIKTLGHVYSSGESNAVRLAEIAQEVCDDLGIEFVTAAVSDSSEVMQAAQSIIGRVDGIYVSNDNTVVSALPSLAAVAHEAGKPVMSADTTSAENSTILVAWGFDYYKMGRATGRIVNDILNGATPESIPTLFMTEPSDIDLLINFDEAKALGINIPEDLAAQANKSIIDGEFTQN